VSAEARQAAQDAADGIASAGTPCVLRQAGAVQTDPDVPVDTTPTDTDILVVPKPVHVRDAAGTLIGVTKTVLTMGALGVKPTKADYVSVNAAKSDAPVKGTFKQVESVETLIFMGVEITHRIMVAD